MSYDVSSSQRLELAVDKEFVFGFRDQILAYRPDSRLSIEVGFTGSQIETEI